MKEIEDLLHDLLVDLSMGETKGTSFIDKWKKEILSLLPDISSLIVEEDHYCSVCGGLGPEHDCQDTDIVKRQATLHDVVKIINSMFKEGHYTEINLGFNNPSGGILKLKE